MTDKLRHRMLLDELEVSDVCDCPTYLVARWYDSIGALVATRILDECADPVIDAAAFLRSRAVSWEIDCPKCTRLYAAGFVQ